MSTLPRQLPRLAALFLLAGLLMTCIDEIDLGQDDALDVGVVLSGRLNNDEDGAELFVRLERLFAFDGFNTPDRVVTARVIIENTEGQEIRLPFRDGAYRAFVPSGDPDFTVAPGIGYRVTATVGEERYQSDYDILPAGLPLLEAEAERETVLLPDLIGGETPREVISYFASGRIARPDGTPAYLRWTVEQTFKLTDIPMIGPNRNNPPKSCYITNAYQGNRVVLFNSEDSPAETVDRFRITAQPTDFHYAEGNVFTIYQESISREAFRYFDQVNQIADQEASIFEPPAGPVVGNVRDLDGRTQNVFGFFYATTRELIRVPVSAEEAGNPFNICPQPPSMSPFPSPTLCDDCSTVNGSVTERPDFFPF